MSRLLLFIFPLFLYGQYRSIPDVVTKVATAAGSFLKLETSARAIGMGGSHVLLVVEFQVFPIIHLVIALLKASEAYFSQVQYLADITHGVLTYGTRLSF